MLQLSHTCLRCPPCGLPQPSMTPTSMLMYRPFSIPCAQKSTQDIDMMDETLIPDKIKKSTHSPTDEQSEVMHAYQSGEHHYDRPASTLAGVQPNVSSENTGVGADEQHRCDGSLLTTAVVDRFLGCAPSLSLRMSPQPHKFSLPHESLSGRAYPSPVHHYPRCRPRRLLCLCSRRSHRLLPSMLSMLSVCALADTEVASTATWAQDYSSSHRRKRCLSHYVISGPSSVCT